MERQIGKIRVASEDRLKTMSIVNLKRYRVVILRERNSFHYRNKNVCCETCKEITGIRRPYTDQEKNDIRTLDWLVNKLKLLIKEEKEKIVT